MENDRYCGNCFRVITDDEKVAYGIGNDKICCMECFNSMEEVHDDYC